MTSPDRKLGEIITIYEPQKSTWNQDALDGFCKAADLRTTVRINAGGKSNPVNHVDLGEVRAFRSVFNPRNLLKSRVDKPGYAETTPNRANGSSDIYLNHRMVTEDMLKESKERFSNEEFIKTLDKCTKKGLIRILAQEKIRQVLPNLAHLAADSAILGSIAGFSLSLLSGVPSNYFFHDSSYDAIYKNNYRLTAEIIPGLISAVLLYYLVEWRKDVYKERANKNYPYIQSLNDHYNFAKPLFDFRAGYSYLRDEERHLLEYTPDPNQPIV
ncbi:MAG: hypothetical protein PHQ59_04280 [Candidatus Daviesbacteria bacterium]|nr:hypothetical protein [Candidatus Daviesbacteria bacterium]